MKVNLEKSLRFCQEVGLDHLELAYIDFSEKTASLIKKMDLKVMSLMATYRVLSTRFKQLNAFMTQVGCKIVCVSVLSLGAIVGRKRAALRFARKLNRLADRYEESGRILAFHHHDYEFREVSGKYKLEWLMQATSPKVKFILDTYWVTKMREDPCTWIEMLGERLIGLHLRDHRRLHNGKSLDCEIGKGTVDFPKIIRTVKPQVIYGVIEQNTKDPEASIRQSVEYCQRLGLL